MLITGYRGSSVARLDEARIRSTLYRKIEAMDTDVKRELTYINKEYQDQVSFQVKINQIIRCY